MKKVLTLLFTLLILTGAVYADENSNKNNLTFLDSEIFDGKMASVLDKNPPQIEIGITGHISTNSIPQRLDKWMSHAAENGDLSMKPVEVTDPNSKAFFLLAPILGFIFQHGGDKWNKSNEERALTKLENYNVTVYYAADDTGDLFIKKLLLTHKP